MIAGSAAVQTPRTPVFSPALGDDPPWGTILVHQPGAAEALELRRTLRAAGYRVVGPAACRADVERFLKGNAIDCAVIDADGGYDLAALFDARAVPLVVLCGDPAGAIPWRAAGRELVPRPYRPGELLRAIHRAMRRPAGGGPHEKRIFC